MSSDKDLFIFLFFLSEMMGRLERDIDLGGREPGVGMGHLGPRLWL